MIVIVDYGTGNVHSVKKALDYLGIEHRVSSNQAIISDASGLILPGVGAYKHAMNQLEKANLVTTIQKYAYSGKPLLGICLGMQLLFENSLEHEITEGLGILPGKILPFTTEKVLEQPIPHMGWNLLESKQKSHLTKELLPAYVYYVHSYYVECANKLIIASSDYGIEVPGLVGKNNIYGAQFHPEKSGNIGLAMLANFKEVM